MTVAVHQMEQILTPFDADLKALRLGQWQVKFAAEDPPLCISCREGWTALRAAINPVELLGDIDARGQAWALLGFQARYAGVKFALSVRDACGITRGKEGFPGPYQIRAEIPVDLLNDKAEDRVWFHDVLRQACQLLQMGASQKNPAKQILAPDSGRKPFQNRNEYSQALPGSEMTDALVDLGYAVEQEGDAVFCVEVPSLGLMRRVRFLPEADGWRAELPAGTGAVRVLSPPIRQAVGQYLLRTASLVRFVRPYSRAMSLAKTQHLSPSGPPGTSRAGQVFGYEVYLPRQAASEHIKHALAALVTAIQRFENEIENLATEAKLARAWLAINGGVTRAASTST